MNRLNPALARDPSLLAHQDAGRHAMQTLFNCYCREVAAPAGCVTAGTIFGRNDWPQSVQMALRDKGGKVLQVSLPSTRARLLAVVAHASPTGNHVFKSAFFYKASGKPWDILDPESLIGHLLNEMAMQTQTPFNDELLEQIRDSITVTATMMTSARTAPFAGHPMEAFIESEQSLVFGHPFHPAPKSRQGISHDDMRRYSPETGARFPLHYFAVRREFLLQQSVLGVPCDEIVADQAPDHLRADSEYALLPTHPWQAKHLLALPLVAEALRAGHLRNLGAQGNEYRPTSSIRTLFHPTQPYFYKCSLNVRITNCVRKNAVYELEGALQVTRIMRSLMPDLQRRFPGVCVLEEPAFMSVDLKDDDVRRNKEVTEGFGLILRRSFHGLLQHGVTPLMAGALFGNGIPGRRRLHEAIAVMSSAASQDEDATALQWFGRYVAGVMHPVLYLYFAHGVIVEPHLQNVVIGVGEKGPSQVFLRDFEGVKLVRERYGAACLQQISQTAREALWYSSELGWKRIAYCLFVNNFCEAISQIGASNPSLQRRLWGIVSEQLQAYQDRHGDDTSASRIEALLAGEAFPGKTNLLNRFFKRPDRATLYVPVPNPLGMLGEDAPWN